MKTKKILLAVMITTISVLLVFAGLVVTAADENSSDTVAYVNFYGSLDSKYASFIDGISLGITDKNDPLYFEKVSLDGMEGMKQYAANSTYINIEDVFYEKGDTEILVNICYYDFGPSEGSYYLEYPTTSGSLNQVRIYKPGRNPGWKYATMILPDCDMSHKYENGASLRIQNGAYNAWHRIEIVNITKARREKTIPKGITALGSIKKRDLEKSKITVLDDPMFSQENSIKPCSAYDAMTIANRYARNGKSVSADNKQTTITQGELLKIFMDALGVKYANTGGIVEYALSIGFIKNDSAFLFDEAPATYSDLEMLMDDVLYYKDADGTVQILKMYNRGFFEGTEIEKIENEQLIAEYYREPRKNPYIKIVDNGTGRTYNYINFFGTQLNRPYLTAQQWLLDGKQFICSTPSGHMYLYNTETQIMRFLAQANTGADGIVGGDGMIYYHGKDGALKTLNRIDPDDPELESKVIYRFPAGVTIDMEVISDDGTWFAGCIQDNNNYFKTPAGHYPVVVFNVPEESKPGIADETYTIRYYAFEEPEKGHLYHLQANPVYKNLVFFCHETNTKNVNYGDMLDRVNIMDMETGEVMTYNQGKARGVGIELATHETWSADGEYLYLVAMEANGGNVMGSSEPIGAIIRINKDGTHRQYYRTQAYESGSNHCFGSADNKWIASDNQFVNLTNMETHQVFPIAQSQRIIGSKGHPYHAHAQIARGHNIMSWGHEHLGVLGIAWYDFSNIVENEVAKGGRYKVNEYVECVSYEDLECESSEVMKNGRQSQMSKAGKSIYYAINPEIADTTNDKIRITFDYLDNSRNPITFTYTKGVKTQNDQLLRFNGEIKVTRKGTGKWKTAVIEIDSANCESIGKYESDFALRGGSTPLYISNMKVEKN